MKFAGFSLHRPAQPVIPHDDEQDHRSGSGQADHQIPQGFRGVLPSACPPKPGFINRPVFGLRDQAKPLADQAEHSGIPALDRAVELAGTHRDAFVELVRDLLFVQQVDRRRLIHDEQAGFAFLRGINNGFIAGIFGDVGDPVLPEHLYAVVFCFHRDGKAAQGTHIGDAAYVLVVKYRHVDRGVGGGKVQPFVAFFVEKDSIDHVVPAVSHGVDSVRPAHGRDRGLDAGFTAPQIPLIDQDALERAFLIAEHIGRIVVVHHDADRVPRAAFGLRNRGVRDDHPVLGDENHQDSQNANPRHDWLYVHVVFPPKRRQHQSNAAFHRAGAVTP